VDIFAIGAIFTLVGFLAFVLTPVTPHSDPAPPIPAPPAPARPDIREAEIEALKAATAAEQALAARLEQALIGVEQPAPIHKPAVPSPPSPTQPPSSKSQELSAWSGRGFTAATFSSVPVYIVLGTPHEIDGIIAAELKKSFGTRLNFVGREQAALFFEIKNAVSYPEHRDSAFDKPKGRTAFDVEAHWITGKSLWPTPLHIDVESPNIENVPNASADTAAQINSMMEAIEMARRRIIDLPQ